MVVTKFGGADVLALQQLPDPQPQPHDLVIEVHAAALNPVDYKIRRGAFGKDRTLPIVLGYDVSGVVVERATEVGSFEIGDEVYASPSLVRNGSNAELVCVDSRTVALKPKRLDHMRAAALPLVTLTAWEALHERAKIEKGQTVLIQAGAGGVGHIAIQLAARAGCRVLATASRDESIKRCEKLGAQVVIDYVKADVVERVSQETEGRGCDVVFDCVGGKVFDQSAQCVAVNGQLVTIVGSADAAAEAMHQLFLHNASLHFEMMGTPTMYGVRPEKQGEILTKAAALVDCGELQPHVSHTLPLEQLAEAHRLQESGHVVGKIGLKVR